MVSEASQVDLSISLARDGLTFLSHFAFAFAQWTQAMGILSVGESIVIVRQLRGQAGIRTEAGRRELGCGRRVGMIYTVMVYMASEPGRRWWDNRYRYRGRASSVGVGVKVELDLRVLQVIKANVTRWKSQGRVW